MATVVKKILPAGLVFLLVVLVLAYFLLQNASQKTTQTPPSQNIQTQREPPGTATASAVLGVQNKTSGCLAEGGLPDRSCTPGAVFPNLTRDQICVSGYAKSVRDVPAQEKDQVYK